jgi:Cdc6-like AAA superfamily ATPase
LEDFEARLQPKMAENGAVAAVRPAEISAWQGATVTEERTPETPARKVAAVSGSARRLVQALRALMSLQAQRAIAAAADAASDVFQA